MVRALWELTENPRNRRWFVSIPTGLEPAQYPTAEAIHEAARAKGINPHSLLSLEALGHTLEKALAVPGEEYSFPAVIEPSFDVRIIISPDKTEAKLYIRKAADKTPLDMKLISGVINNSGLRGMNAESIRNRIKEFSTSADMELTDLVLAEGTPPGRGADRELLPKVECLSDAGLAEIKQILSVFEKSKPPAESDRLFPSAEAQKIAMVTEGEIVCLLSLTDPGPDGVDVYGKPIPGLPGNDPFIQTVENVTLGPSGLKAEKTGVFLLGEKDGKVRVRVIPYVSGSSTITVSDDKMLATVTLCSEIGAGKKLDLEMVRHAIADAGIREPADFTQISATIKLVRSTGIEKKLILARGQKPVPKGGFRIEWATTNPDGSHESIVQESDRILTIQSMPQGCEGFDVYGNSIPASGPGEEVPPHDETIIEKVETLEAGKTGETGKTEVICYVAARSGELRTGKTLSISDTRKYTGTVSAETGDMSFPGNLEITGEIKTGRTVKASGYLHITGNAEACLLSADKSVTMIGGIRGAGRGTVWAKQDITLTFAENARILAGQDISIDNYCFQCTVKTNGTLYMRGNPAVLMGGTVRASKGIEVFELGSEKPIRTSISFGQNYLVSDQIEVCEKETRTIKETIEKLNDAMKKTPANDPAIHDLRRRKLELLKRNDKLTVRIFTLKEQFETHVISHIRVNNTVYPGVVLESHGRYYEVREQMHHVVFIFDQTTGQITCNPIPEE